MKVFLTGGSGFIGSWVVKELLSFNHELKILVKNPKKLPHLYSLPNVEIVEGFLTDYQTIFDALDGMDACIHIALGWGDTPVEMLENDTRSTIHLLESAAHHNLKHFIATSSTAAIGEIRSLMNEDINCRPVDLYGATKSASEKFILGFSHSTNMKCNIIRPGYTFGNPAFPGGSTQPDQRFHDIVRNALQGKEIHLTQYDGTQFIEAQDLAKIYSSTLHSQLNRQIFHGLSSSFVKWSEVAEQAVQLCDSQSPVVLEDKGWAPEPCLYGVTQIKNHFDLEFSPDSGIQRHLEYLISYLSL